MSVFLSPGVYSQEKDISDIVPKLATSSAAIVGYSAKGDTDNIVLITNDQQFIAEYGKPVPGEYFHYSALAYLAKGNTLYCLRVHNGALYGGVNIMASTSSESNAAIASGQASRTFVADSGADDVVFQILGANPGVWNNRLTVKVSDIKESDDLVVTDRYTFLISVYYENDDGDTELVETWKVSRKDKIDGFGKQLYLEDKINGVSKYIYVSDSALADTVLPKPQATELAFLKGSDGSAATASEFIAGWNEFINPSVVDVRLLLNGGESDATVQAKMKTVAETRADCIAILDMPSGSISSVTDMSTFRSTTQNINSSYCALYSPWVTIYDEFNDRLVDVPPSGHVAAQMAYNDRVGQPWTAPAGFNRGRLDVLDVTYNFTEGERDTLYQIQVNPLQTFKGEGSVIWGQKTEQTKSSALSRINVRRLLIVIEKAMAISLRGFLFEGNNEITRFRVEALLNEYLETLSAQGAFQTEGEDGGFHVVCDTTNNTPAIIDGNDMRVDVFVKPTRTAEFIRLQTIVTPTGASFNELQARGIMF
jgi:hypothetical protein